MKKTLRKATTEEFNNWDELISNNPYGVELYQAKSFASIKQRQGWHPEFWVYETSFGKVYALALVRKIIGLGRVIYIPRGPSVIDVKQWGEICRISKRQLTDAVAIKMEPPIRREKLRTLRDDLRKVGEIQKSVVNTVVLDLTLPEEEILASFRQRARRSIRGGRKEQLAVTEGVYSPKNVDQMWSLYKETAKRAGIKTRPKSYFANFWRQYIENDQGRFYFVWAPDDENPIAGAFVCFVGDVALYKDGGSRRDTQTHFSHLLQWQVMQSLRGKGIARYDLGGTPPSDRLEDSTHRLASLATFKMSFGAPVIDYVGAYDQILKPKAYKKWRVIQRLWRDAMWRTPFRDIY